MLGPESLKGLLSQSHCVLHENSEGAVQCREMLLQTYNYRHTNKSQNNLQHVNMISSVIKPQVFT